MLRYLYARMLNLLLGLPRNGTSCRSKTSTSSGVIHRRSLPEPPWHCFLRSGLSKSSTRLSRNYYKMLLLKLESIPPCLDTYCSLYGFYLFTPRPIAYAIRFVNAPPVGSNEIKASTTDAASKLFGIYHLYSIRGEASNMYSHQIGRRVTQILMNCRELGVLENHYTQGVEDYGIISSPSRHGDTVKLQVPMKSIWLNCEALEVFLRKVCYL